MSGQEGERYPVRLTTKQGQASPVQEGTVQWFSNSKGYGFIRGQDGVERFFHVTDLTGDFMPDRGDSVFFQSKQDGKGPRAAEVALNPNFTAEPNHIRRDGRVSCPNCSRPIVPRMTFWDGRPYKSYCTFCGGMIRNFYKYKPSTLDKLWSLVKFSVVFISYIWILLFGMYFFATGYESVEVWRLLLGISLLTMVVINIFKFLCWIIAIISSKLKYFKSFLKHDLPSNTRVE